MVVAHVVLEGHAVPSRLLGLDPGFDEAPHVAFDALEGEIDDEVHGSQLSARETQREFI